MPVETWANVLSIVGGIILSVGVIAGGIWRIYIHRQQRGKYAKVNLTQKVRAIRLTDDRICIHTSAEIKNIGEVMLSLCSAKNIIYQIQPLHASLQEALHGRGKLYDELNKEIDWPILDSKEIKWDQNVEIEPGEHDIVSFDMVIPSHIEVVQVYTYFPDIKKRGPIGWQTSQFYDISKLVSGGGKE
jgi:hypothetical protein